MTAKLALVAVCLGALISPASSWAEGPPITNGLGEAAETVQATSENVSWTTALGSMECTTFNLHVQLTENGNTAAKGAGTGTAEGNPSKVTHTGACVSSSGLGTDVLSFTVADLQIASGVGGTLGFSMTYRFTSGSTVVAHCHWNASAVIQPTGTSSLSMSGSLTRGEHSSAVCPQSGSIKGDFTLHDEFALPAHLD